MKSKTKKLGLLSLLALLNTNMVAMEKEEEGYQSSNEENNHYH